MVLVPGGTFTMGNTGGFGDNGMSPPHTVTVSAFCMDKTEVTVASYRRCAQEERNGIKCSEPPTTVYWNGFSKAQNKFWSQFCNGGRADRDTHPLNCVDWDQASTHCRWTGGRLPTEAEWEFAARGTDTRAYPWGDEAPTSKHLNACGTECRAAVAQAGWTYDKILYEEDDGAATTAPVGSYPRGASPFGVLDMAGNVAEWAADWFARYPHTDAPMVDPKGPEKPGEDEERAIRSWGWDLDEAFLARVAIRTGRHATMRFHTVGFRCVHAPNP
jgi:formylglycine-generating enzyme required for sulfatase activity